MENAKAMAEEQGYTFPILYGLDRLETAEKLGAFQEEKRNILHATNFVLKGDQIISLTISSGPVGRLSADDAIRFITFNQKKSS